MNAKVIGYNIQKLRKLMGESQATLASAIGVTDAAVSQYETGVRVPADDIKIKIAKHYNVSVQSVFYDHEMQEAVNE